MGNTIVDRMAREATSEGVEISVLPFYTDCLHLVKKMCCELWKEFFDKRSKEKGIWYKTIQAEPLMTPWIRDTSMNRRDTVVLLRLRSGHIPFNKFAYLIGKAPTPNCTECGVVEDVFHILMECVRNESMRRSIFNTNCIYQSIGGINIVLGNISSKLSKNLIDLYNVAVS
ncbi:jg22870 [Pararge aegeria aegeria]|uniref:Jg22870 protein n=1 Tax=Pararge aegeria aegeria TaxID=348720 RepID=A0A8S4R0L0_9NEOP|nr:jg22870 [Pararge aegeria aegeria]